MKREIKFRAWDGEMMWDHAAIDKSDTDGIIMFGDLFKDPQKHGFLAVMQYTGLKDSKGTEIYEGDIVYLAGQGDTVIEWPFIDLYTAGAENDIGEIKGNIHEK